MTSYPGPVVQRDLLIKHLRGLRRSAGQSDADVATALGWPLPTGSARELGSGFTP